MTRVSIYQHDNEINLRHPIEDIRESQTMN